MEERPSIIYRVFQTVMALIAAKKLRVPQPFRVFGIHEVEDSFRLFQAGRNSGKMAIEMRVKDLVLVSIYQFSHRFSRSRTDFVPPDRT